MHLNPAPWSWVAPTATAATRGRHGDRASRPGRRYEARSSGARAAALPATSGTTRRARIPSAPTRCSTARAPSSSASSTPATIASRARPAARVTWRSSKPPSAACMATGAMLWGGAAYNNGILPTSSSTSSARPTTATASAIAILKPRRPITWIDERRGGILPQLYPLPPGRRSQPGDIFRVFERGGRNNRNLFPEIGLPNAPASAAARRAGPARHPPVQSRAGTGARIAVPVINITRRASTIRTCGSSARTTSPATTAPRAARVPRRLRERSRSAALGPYAAVRPHRAEHTVDPTIPKNESGHPLRHSSRARCRPASA